MAAPYTGHFRPLGNLQGAFQGLSAAALSGMWKLTITVDQGDTATTGRELIGASLDFTSGNSDITNNPASEVNAVALNSGTKTFSDGIQGVPVLPNPSIASDNTLGLNSPFSGRLYIALTNDNFNFNTGAPTTSTFIELYSSDDGGNTWGFNGIVNDDDGLTDGFSTGGYAQPANVILASQVQGLTVYSGDLEADVRPKIEPQVAVDQYTGTVVVSYLDTRNDASAVRVATYIAASTDGGSTFAPESYANPVTNAAQLPVEDAITGAPVVLGGPVPDNESSGNNDQETTFGFGQHQGLAIADGEIIPVWASNENQGSKTLNQKVSLEIVSAQVTYAAGPRVIASTQGPVGQPGDTVNTDREADGTPIANTIVFTFDRAVDPATFQPDNGNILSPLEVFYNNPNGTSAPIRLPVISVTPDPTDTVFTVTFDPTNPATGLPYGVGSYSYILQPFVQGMIPYQSLINVIEQVPILDSAGVTGPTSSSFTVAGFPGVGLSNASITANINVYQAATAPAPAPTATDVEIFLVPQGGTPILLFSTPTAGDAAGTVIPVSANIAIPAGELLDQTYTVMVVDNVPGQQVFVFNDVNPNDFNFQVQLDVGLTTTIMGNLLDQNANGIPGEQPGDDYSIPDGRLTLPLIVPGPHVVTTTVVGVNGTTGTGTDNLVNNDNVKAVDVTFDRDMQVSSFTPAQVLAIQGPTGQINSPQTFVSTGIAKNFAFNGSFQLIPKAPATGPNTGLTSSIIIENTGSLLVSDLTVQVNVTDPNDSSLSLALEAPNGVMVPLVNAGTAAGANFTNTVFSDAPPANGLTSTIPAGQAPYSLTYQPASPLSALAGVALQGTWKLIIVDSTNAGAQGRLNGWSLSITPQVPEGPSTALDTPLVVSAYPDNSFTIAHLAVQLNITSTKDSDLQINLVSPKQANGSQITVPLVLSGSTSGQNFTNTIFDDNGTIPIASGAAPYSLTYQPASPLSALDGLSINGTWTLQIVNPNVDNSVTTLNSWSLIATPQITITPVNPVNGAARTFAVGFPTQILSGNYTVTLSPNILSVAANPANPSMGTPLDTNLNAGVDALEGIASGPTTSDNFKATAVPVAIPYAIQPAQGAKVPGVLTSQIDVTDNFPVQGDVGLLAGLTVTLNIAYYFDPDLTVTLTAPGINGRTITLFSGVGKGGTNANFTNTTLSDTTTPVAPITAAGAPFFGTFNPEQPLSLFQTDTTGATQFSGGLWTLTITNTGTGSDHGIPNNIAAMLNSWSLDFQKPQVNTGLGEPVADQVTVGFRLFNFAPNNPLANDTWTAVGPAGTIAAPNPNNVTGGAASGADLAGPVSVVALDPADPSGNTAYIGASSGGIWKTTDFLTTSPSGPTYVPLTDFGANYAINIGSIAIFDRNNDPNQSIIFAGTGDGQATTANAGNSVQGVGILRSMNGGASFTLLDSSVNVDANGNPLPINSPLRDHIFVGTTTYKIIVDPTPTSNGGVIVYAALGGPHGGLWRSDDGGNHWTNLSQGVIPQVNGQNAAATDVLLDPASASNSTGNLDILYAAFEGVGVFISSNRGVGLSELFGNVGADNLIQDAQVAGAAPLTVGNIQSPNGNFGRIILAKPALTNSSTENILYQDWLYVAVENANGTFKGLYVTKDRGENWTKAQIASIPDTGLVPTVAEPTNDNLQTNNYDFTNGATVPTQNGNAHFSKAIDPSNPNIVYLGGTQDYQTSGLIRVDLTGLFDAHAYAPFADDLDDGGALTLDSNGRVNSNPLANAPPFFQGINPAGLGTGFNYINLRHSPITVNAFDVNSTQFVFDSTAFNNDGYGVKWTPIDAIYDSPLDGSTNIHQLLTIVDPLTGLTRLIIADDQGVFTGVFNADGSLNTSGIGTAATATGSRNGNLQDEELYYSAAQPSTLAAQTAGALFYGSGIGMTDAQSDPNLFSDGNLTWTVAGTAYGDLQDVILTNDRGGTGIATDATGGTTISNPIGTGPSLYEFDTPQLGGDTTNFFRVNNSGQTTGLVNNFRVEFPANGVLSNGNGVSQLGNFAVNPLNGSQILISSNLGNVYETVNKGVQWLEIGAGQAVAPGVANFDGTYAAALTYGAPDPNAPGGLGNLNNFIYVGTIGTESTGGNVPGHIYVTQNGGGTWQSISNGLDGSSVVAIYTNPNRGSHEAYAVTLNGVYYMANSLAPNATWVNITGNLTQIQDNSFGDPTLAQNALLGYTGANGQLGGFRSIVADFRYAIPDPVNPSVTYPILYVSGYGGVFRSLDNGQTWTEFPDVNFDSAPAEGGYLPNVDVTSLQLDLGAINPATGHATQDAGDREVLLASTLGRGDFAIGLAPIVLPNTILLDPNLPAPGGSDSGAANGNPDVTNVVTPFIDGVSEISNFGNIITINIYDETGGPGQGTLLGTGTTDPFGNFAIQLVNNGSDPSFFTSSTSLNDKVIGIQATDSSGASGNITKFAYTLDTITPNTPSSVILESKYDTGRSSTDNITDLSIPAPTPGSGLSIVTPIFDISTPLPPANPLTPFPITLTVELLRSLSPTGPFTVVATVPGGSTSPVMLSDPGLAALAAAAQINTTFYYEAEQVDQAGNVSLPSPELAVTVVTTTPPTLQAPVLDPSTNSGSATPPYQTNFTMPTFDLAPGNTLGSVTVNSVTYADQLYLYRSINGSTPILVGVQSTVGVGQVTDTTVGLPDGVYTYYLAQQDIAGNFSALSPGTVVTINTQVPPNTPVLQPLYDTGRFNNDDITNIAIPMPTPGVTPTFVSPVFNITTVPPPAGEPVTVTVELLRSTSPTGPFAVVGSSVEAGANPIAVTDTSLAAILAASQINDYAYYYELGPDRRGRHQEQAVRRAQGHRG